MTIPRLACAVGLALASCAVPALTGEPAAGAAPGLVTQIAGPKAIKDIGGALQGGATSTGERLAFDGRDDYAEIPHRPAWLLDEGTLAFWFRPQELSGRRGLVCKDAYGAGDGGHLTIRTEERTLHARLQGTDSDHELAAPGLKERRWHHAALVFGPDGMRLFLDGRQAGRDPHAGGLGKSSGGAGNHEPLVLGALSWARGRRGAPSVQNFFHGQLADLRIYNRALTADDVAALAKERPARSAETTPEPPPRPHEPSATLFKHHYVDRDVGGRHLHPIELLDVDGDKRLDIVLGLRSTPPVLVWYRNTGRIGDWGTRRTLAERTPWEGMIHGADIDGDGWTDIVAKRVWYRNLGGQGKRAAFQRITYDPSAATGNWTGPHDVMAADLTGDARPEILVFGDKYGGPFLFQSQGDLTQPWQKTRLNARARDAHAAIEPHGVGDLNGDGRPDIVFINGWFENTGRRAADWTWHGNIPFGKKGKWGIAVRTWVADIDRDGRPDVVQSDCDVDRARVAWFRNARGDGSAWEKHLLPEPGPTGDYHSLVVADFDRDGDLDVYADEMEHIHLPPDRPGRAGRYVWENRDGRGETWRKHTLLLGLGGHQAQGADLDGDGDVDVVTKLYDAHPDNINKGKICLSVMENVWPATKKAQATP